MKPTRARRKKNGPSVALSFTASVEDTASFDAVAGQLGLTRAAFFYKTVAKEVRRIQKKAAVFQSAA